MLYENMHSFLESVTYPHCHAPHFDDERLLPELDTIFRRGSISDPDLIGRIKRLDRLFSVYARYCHLGLWGPGLVVSQEMAAITELYLPINEIGRAFRRLLACSLQIPLFFEATPFPAAASWLDVLPRLQPDFQRVNPADTLALVCHDERSRLRLIYSLFLPAKYGGGFNRYPLQQEFLKGWLTSNRRRFSKGIRCLDAACASGEGVYGLAALLQDASLPFHVRGETVEPIELFSACHCFMPHDDHRQSRYRRLVGRLSDLERTVSFALWDVVTPSADAGYQIVLCNGLLGGPILNDQEMLRRAISHLVARLDDGGLFLAADHFHGGWKKKVPPRLVERFLCEAGLRVVQVAEGVAATKE